MFQIEGFSLLAITETCVSLMPLFCSALSAHSTVDSTMGRWIRLHPLTSIACSVVQQGWRWSGSWLSVAKISRGIRTGITYCFPLPNPICISWILICNYWKSLSESSYLVVLIGLIPLLKVFLCFSWIAGRNAKSTRMLSGFICPDIWGLGTCWWASAYRSSDSCWRVHQDKW